MIVGRKVGLRRPPDRGWEHEWLVIWRNDPANKPFFVEEEPLSLDSHLAWWDRVSQDPCQRLYLIEAMIGTMGEPLGEPLLIGTIGLEGIDRRSGTAEYTRLLIGNTDYRGGGYGFESEFLLLDHAFNFLNMHKVWGEVFTYNEIVLRLHEKTGFRQEGILRQHAFKGGEYHDLILIGLLAEEFRAIEGRLREELGLP